MPRAWPRAILRAVGVSATGLDVTESEFFAAPAMALMSRVETAGMWPKSGGTGAVTHREIVTRASRGVVPLCGFPR